MCYAQAYHCFFVVFLAASAQAEAKSSKIIPEELGQAQYVALGYDLGGRFLNDDSITRLQNRILPQDREALQQVRSALEKWKHYVIVLHPNDAQLLIVVRTDRLAAAGMGIGSGRRYGGLVYGAEASSPDDLLEVYESNQGREGAVLWRKLQKDGLSGSPPPLFKQFRQDVDSLPLHHP